MLATRGYHAVMDPERGDAPNSRQAIERRVALGQVRWDAIIILASARLVLALLAQGLAALLGRSTYVEAGAWMTVWASLVDLGCLALLVYFLRREGLRLRDLFHARARAPLRRTLMLVPLILVGLGGLGFAVAAVTGLLLFGAVPPPPTSTLPLWGGLYSVLVWPLLWGFTEQATYDGYLAPRAQALGRKQWALAIVVLGWAAQHLALPYKPDLAFLATRFLPSCAIAVACVAWYLKERNLVPFAIAHWLIDAATGALTLR